MRFFSFIIAILALLGGCGRSDDSGRPVIVVSTPAVGRIVEEIAGDSLEVLPLLPPGADPENYEPDMATMKRASRADAFLTLNTIGFEQRLSQQLSASMPNLPKLELTDGIEMLEDSHGHSHSHAHSHSRGHDHSSTEAECDDDHGQTNGDPHLLSSPENARIVARNAVAALSRLYPAQAATFRRRGLTLDSLLAAQQKTTGEILRNARGSAFVVLHPSLSYYAHEYDLRQIAIEREGKETTPRQLEQRLKEAEAANPVVMVSDRSHNPEQATLIARTLRLPIVSADFNAADFLTQYTRLAKAITNK